MKEEALLSEIASAIGLEFSEETVLQMLKIAEFGVSAENLARIIEDVRTEVAGAKKNL